MPDNTLLITPDDAATILSWWSTANGEGLADTPEDYRLMEKIKDLRDGN